MSRTPLISIVDDDAFVRQATENLLLSLGFDVVTFTSAEQFLESGRADDSSCLITDVQMPGLTGLDLQQRLIDDGRRLPIIFITAFFSERLKVQTLEAGAVGFLRKPFDEETLIQCLSRALEGASGLSGTDD
jgi:FixJ family two-component response regulator